VSGEWSTGDNGGQTQCLRRSCLSLPYQLTVAALRIINEATVFEDLKQVLIYQLLKLETYLHFWILSNVIFCARFHCIITIYKFMLFTGVYKVFGTFWNNWRISIKLCISCQLMPLPKTVEGLVKMNIMRLDKTYEMP
jgi:hypothetical protein